MTIEEKKNEVKSISKIRIAIASFGLGVLGFLGFFRFSPFASNFKQSFPLVPPLATYAVSRPLHQSARFAAISVNQKSQKKTDRVARTNDSPIFPEGKGFKPSSPQKKKAHPSSNFLDSVTFSANIGLEQKKMREVSPQLHEHLFRTLPQNINQIHQNIPERTESLLDFWNAQLLVLLHEINMALNTTLQANGITHLILTDFTSLEGPRTGFSGLAAFPANSNQPKNLTTEELKQIVTIHNRNPNARPLDYFFLQQVVDCCHEREKLAPLLENVGKQVEQTQQLLHSIIKILKPLVESYRPSENLVSNKEFSSRVILYTKALPGLYPFKGVFSYDFLNSQVVLGLGKNAFVKSVPSSNKIGVLCGVYAGPSFDVNLGNKTVIFNGLGLYAFCGLGVSF